jgi:hypothetical protein
VSKVSEIHRRLKKLDEAKYFPSGCIDIAEKLIRKTTDLEFTIAGSIEFAWRRGFQAGLESGSVKAAAGDVLDEIEMILEAVARRPTLVVMDEDTVMAGELTEDVRRKAYEILVIVRNLKGGDSGGEDEG